MLPTEHLQKWLIVHNAKFLNSVKGPTSTRLDFYNVNGKCIIFQIFKDEGWNAYISCSDSNYLLDNFSALNEYIIR